ncbi:MAG: formate dehydrogenase subunit alpha [Pseudomonadota bacterium]
MSDTIKLIINDIDVTTRKGVTILEAAVQAGIYIPTLCYCPDVSPGGVCRICIVRIQGRKKLHPACSTPVAQGMVVVTDNPEIERIRKVTLELILSDHDFNCLLCSKNGLCRLQKLVNRIGYEEERYERLNHTKKTLSIDQSNPFFDFDPNKCVHCLICVRTCREISGTNAIDVAQRGYDLKISTFGNKPFKESVCVSCGECVERCPVGALIPKQASHPTSEIRTICPYCGVGCGLLLGVRGIEIVRSKGDLTNPVNKGDLCVRGRYGYRFVNHIDRLSEPLIRAYDALEQESAAYVHESSGDDRHVTSPMIKREGKFVEVTWGQVLKYVASTLSHYKGDQFAAIASAKCTNEENYLFQKFTRAVMQTNNIDHCARLGHSPTVAGLSASFGSGEMTNSISDIGKAACIFAIGTNTTATHPIIARAILRAVRNGAKLIVADPREISLSQAAHVWLRHYPGTDVALLNGMMRVMLDEGLIDRGFIKERCEGFEEFEALIKNFNLDIAEELTGVSQDDIAVAARMFSANSPAMILYAMGITQHSHGADNVRSIANLALITGNIGKPGSGVSPLRGQNNVQGACDMGALPNVFPGYQRVDNEDVRKKFEGIWGYDLNPLPGLTLTEMFEAAHVGKIKAMYLIGENPVVTNPNSSFVERAISSLELFIVQDIFLTETARMADIVLPATSFAEKEGTFTNTERRVQRVRKAIDPVGGSRPDWMIIEEIAQNMGAKGFDFSTTQAIMEEIRSVTPDYAGITYERIDKTGIQWPCPNIDHIGTPYLYAESFSTPSGRGHIAAVHYRRSFEVVSNEYPLILTTSRNMFHYHSVLSRKVEGLNALRGEEELEINPADAAGLEIQDSEIVIISSKRGSIKAKARLTKVVPTGVVSMSFHYPETRTNIITSKALDPLSKIPEFKVCAVKVEKEVSDSIGRDSVKWGARRKR